MKKSLKILFIVFIAVWHCVSFSEESHWRRLFRGPVVLHCDKEDIRCGETIISMIDEALPAMSEQLGLSQCPEINVLIAPSQSVFDQMTGGQIPEWGVAAANPDQSVIFLKSPRFARPEIDLNSVVLHEMSHVLLFRATGGKPVDRWFDEGLAMMLSGERQFSETLILARAVLAGKIIWLDEIDEVLTFRKQKANLAYRESLSAVQYFVDRFGSETLVRLIQQIGQNETMDTALESTIGMGFGEFEDSWYQAMKVKYRWAVFLNVPFVVSVMFVVLFLSAFIATRIRMKKRRELWEKEDLYGFETVEDHQTPC